MAVKVNADVWSEFEILEQYIKVAGGSEYEDMSCVGTAEHELESRTVTKKCRGIEVKNSTKGTGKGTLTESLHVPRHVYNKIYAMNQTGLKEGVIAYGQDSRHPEFSLTLLIENEDGERMYRAYPRCKVVEGPKKKIENGAEEVAELELVMNIFPDDHGNGVYEVVVEDLPEDSELRTNWLTGFDPEMVYTA